MNIAAEMLEYRARNNISQKELARRCNLSVQTINSIENNHQTPSKLTNKKIRNVIKEIN